MASGRVRGGGGGGAAAAREGQDEQMPGIMSPAGVSRTAQDAIRMNLSCYLSLGSLSHEQFCVHLRADLPPSRDLYPLSRNETQSVFWAHL